MTLTPLLGAGPVVQLHVVAAAAALFTSAAVVFSQKGTARHVLAGRIAVVALIVTALSSFGITHGGHFSWIHGLSIVTLVTLAMGLRSIRNGSRRAHAANMIGAVSGLTVAGFFTLMPGRILHVVVFGT